MNAKGITPRPIFRDLRSAKLAIPMVILAAGLVQAAGLRESDTQLSAAQTEAAIAGQVIEFYDGSAAHYGPGDAYAYVYAPGDPPFVGRYEARDGGQVCVEFENGFSRCDIYVEADGRLVLIIADGTRFPVREVRAME